MFKPIDTAKTLVRYEAECQAVLNFFRPIIKGKIVNQPVNLTEIQAQNLTSAKEIQIHHAHKLDQSAHAMPAKLARHCFIFIIATVLLCKELTSEKGSIFTALCFTFLLFALIKRAQGTFLCLPLEHTGINLFLDKQKSQLVNLSVKHEYARQHALQLYPTTLRYFFFMNSKTQAAIQNGTIEIDQHDAMMIGLAQLKRGAFDCIGLSALAILKLLRNGFSADITRFMKPGLHDDGHSYAVTNLLSGDPQNMSTWNDDAIILDLWYDLCISLKDAKADKDFLLKYPLLDPTDKISLKKIIPQQLSSGYDWYLQQFDRLMQRHVQSNIEQGFSQ